MKPLPLGTGFQDRIFGWNLFECEMPPPPHGEVLGRYLSE